MQRIVSPPVDQLEKLRTSLTKGEKIVFEIFNSLLAPEWEIYIQPYLNGLRPDFVLLNPKVGIAVFEVKDWDLKTLKYNVETLQGKRPKLFGNDKNGKFSLQRENPVEKIFRYKCEINELYCPRLDDNYGLAVITGGIIFPFAKDEDVKRLLSPCLQYRNMNNYPIYYPVTGSDAIRNKRIDKIFPENARRPSDYMNVDIANDLRHWLVEPDFSSTQRNPVILDKAQLNLVKSRTKSGYRRIKGPAGSGKSYVLAARAAELILEGKEVLIVTYNITLINYLRDIISRYLWDPKRRYRKVSNTLEKITWLNYHFWCKRVCQYGEHEEDYNTLWKNYHDGNTEKEDIFKEELSGLASDVINSERELILKYDAVFVDEGQDFNLNWWNTLRMICRKGGEMLLVADQTQDIYNRTKAWTEEKMIGAGFDGKWVELRVSYRLPDNVQNLLNYFVKKFMPGINSDPPGKPCQLEIQECSPCKLRWIQTSLDKAMYICVREIQTMAVMAEPDILSIPDTTFLTSNIEFGMKVVRELEKNIKVINTFSSDGKESRKKKMYFFMGDSRIKATTIHSFKGWESCSVVLFVSQSIDKALLYTGLTRIKKRTEGSYLTVICCDPKFAEFGKKWPDYKEE